MEVTGIILAGGKSSRMGVDKGLVELCGKPLISYALDALAPLCSSMLISSFSDAYKQFGAPVISDEVPSIGPMGGIYSALRQSKTKHNLVLSCDLPFASTDLFRFLLDQSSGFQVAVPWQGNHHYEPLCAFYDLSVLDTMTSFIRKENFKLPDLFEEIDVNRLIINESLDFYHPNLFFNINSKHDLAAAEKVIDIIK